MCEIKIKGTEIKGRWNGKFYAAKAEGKVRIYVDNAQVICKKEEIEKTDSYGKVWEDSDGAKYRYHYYPNGTKAKELYQSAPEKNKEKIAGTEKYIKIGGGQGYGYSDYVSGQIVEDRDNSRWLTVVSASRTYYGEDGLSFGVGDEQGYIYSAACRLATESEIEKEIEKKQEKAIKENTNCDILKLKKELLEKAESVTEKHT